MLLMLLKGIASKTIQANSLDNTNNFYTSIINVSSIPDPYNLPSVGNSPISGVSFSSSFFKTASSSTLNTTLFENKVIRLPVGDAITFGSNTYGASVFSGGFINRYYGSIYNVSIVLGLTYPALYTNTNTLYTPTILGGATNFNLSFSIYNNTNNLYIPNVIQKVNPTYSVNPNNFYTNIISAITPTGVSPSNIPSVSSSPIGSSAFAGAFYKTVIAYNLVSTLFDNSKTIKTTTVDTATFGGTIYGSTGFSGGFTNKYYTSINITAVIPLGYTYPTLYNNTNTFYTPTISRGSRSLSNILYSNSNTFYIPTISRGTRNLTSTLYTNTNTLYAPQLSFGGLLTTLFTNTTQFYDPIKVLPGLLVKTTFSGYNVNYFYYASIDLTGSGQVPLPSTFFNSNNFYPSTLYLQSAQTLSATRLTNTSIFDISLIQKFGAPRITLAPFIPQSSSIYNSTILKGSVTLSNINKSSGSILYTPNVVQKVHPISSVNTHTFYSHSLIRVPVNISFSIHTNNNIFKANKLVYTARIYPETYTNINIAYSASANLLVTQNLSPALYNNINAYNITKVIYAASLLTSLHTNTEQVYGPKVTASISTDLYTNINELDYEQRLIWRQFLYPSKYNNINQYLNTSISITVSTSIYNNTSQIFNTKLNTASYTSLINSAEEIFTPIVKTYSYPSLYININQIFNSSVNTTMYISVYNSQNIIYPEVVNITLQSNTNSVFNNILGSSTFGGGYGLVLDPTPLGALVANTYYNTQELFYSPTINTLTVLTSDLFDNRYVLNYAYTQPTNSAISGVSVLAGDSSVSITRVKAPSANIFTDTYSNINEIYSSSVVYIVKPPFYVNTSAIHLPIVTRTLNESLYENIQQFFSFKLTTTSYSTLYTDIDEFFTPAVRTYSYSSLYTNQNKFFNIVLGYGVYPTLYENQNITYFEVVNVVIQANSNNVFNNIFGSSGFGGGYNYVLDPIPVVPLGDIRVNTYTNNNGLYLPNVNTQISISADTYYNNYTIYPFLNSSYYTIGNIPSAVTGNVFGGELYNINMYNYYKYISVDYLESLRTYSVSNQTHQYKAHYKNNLLLSGNRTNSNILDSSIIEGNHYYITAVSNPRNNIGFSTNKYKTFIGKETIKPITYRGPFYPKPRDTNTISKVRVSNYYLTHYTSAMNAISRIRNNFFKVMTIKKFLSLFSNIRNHSMFADSRSNSLMAGSRTRVFTTGKRVK